MRNKYLTTTENSLIWFGAGVSIAEILTGTCFAPLGFVKGTAAILLGHVIGCFLLFLSGCIGGTIRKSSMDAVKMSFGDRGGLLFALLNILQLVGWTSIMIYDGALAADGILSTGRWLWCLVIGGLITIWLIIGIRSLGKLNIWIMSSLFILTVILSFIVFGSSGNTIRNNGILTFGMAVELSAAMPLSWLPLISDYTRDAEKPVKASAVSAVVYGIVSCWMYIIGMGAAIFTGESDIAQIMLRAGLGTAGLFIVVLSTVSTTFLDAFSAGISWESVSGGRNGRSFAIGVTVISTACAVFFPITDITDFLYLIGSVFAPMIAVQIADFFIIRHYSCSCGFNIHNLGIWLAGFIIYRFMMRMDFVLGVTLPAMLVTILLCLFFHRIKRGKT